MFSASVYILSSSTFWIRSDSLSFHRLTLCWSSAVVILYYRQNQLLKRIIWFNACWVPLNAPNDVVFFFTTKSSWFFSILRLPFLSSRWANGTKFIIMTTWKIHTFGIFCLPHCYYFHLFRFSVDIQLHQRFIWHVPLIGRKLAILHLFK